VGHLVGIARPASPRSTSPSASQSRDISDVEAGRKRPILGCAPRFFRRYSPLIIDLYLRLERSCECSRTVRVKLGPGETPLRGQSVTDIAGFLSARGKLDTGEDGDLSGVSIYKSRRRGDHERSPRSSPSTFTRRLDAIHMCISSGHNRLRVVEDGNAEGSRGLVTRDPAWMR